MKQKSILTLALLGILYTSKSQSFDYTRARIDIANNNDYSTFYLLDTTVARYNIFFSGENHQFRASNAKLELKLLKYLHRTAGVKHLLLEFGYTSGYLVDRYVYYGDTTAYAILKAYFAETYLWLFKGVKEFNATLDSTEKIRVHGIDFEDNMYFTVKTILNIMPDKEAPDEIGLQIETLRNMDSRYSKNSTSIYYNSGLGSGIYGNYYQADNTMREVLESYDKNKTLYDTYFGDNAYTMDQVMEHVRYYLEWRDYITTGKMQERPYRERYMFSNFMNLLEKNPGEKFFGQFGRCHTSTNRTDEECDVNYYNSLVGKINTHPNDYLKNKVCVIAGIYPKIEFNTFKLQSYEVLQKMRKAASDTGITLFPVLNDSVNYGELHKHYKFVFINNNSPSGEREITYNTTHTYRNGFLSNAANNDLFIGFSYRFQLSGIKTSKLNAFYSSFGLKEPTSPLLMQGISFTVLDNLMGNFFDAGYSWLPDMITRTSDTSEFSFTASSAHIKFGKDLFDLTPLINLMPSFGICYNELRIRHTITNSGQLFQTENIPAEITYKNPAILVDFSMHFSTQIYFIGLSAYGGYQIDFSSKKWRKDGSYSTAAPATSLGGWYAGVSIGLFFFE
ncbi:MAG: erythromycin esterase family protein [Flavobacteriales bacterium]